MSYETSKHNRFKTEAKKSFETSEMYLNIREKNKAKNESSLVRAVHQSIDRS